MVAVSLILSLITPVRATAPGTLSTEPGQAMPRDLPAAAETASPGLPHLPPAGLEVSIEPATAQALVKHSCPASEARITPEGGELASADGRTQAKKAQK